MRVPDFALFKVPKYEYIPETYNFEMKDLYSPGERIIVLTEKYFGNIGIIEKIEDKTAQVKFVETSCVAN